MGESAVLDGRNCINTVYQGCIIFIHKEFLKYAIMTLKWPHLNIYELRTCSAAIAFVAEGGSALYSFYKNLLNMNIPPSKAEHAVAYLDLLRTFDQYEEEIWRTIGKESK